MIKKYKYVDILKGFDFTEKKIIIWGTSFAALDLYIELANKANIIGFTDSFTEKNGTFAGLPLYTYSEVEKLYDENTWLYISTGILKYQIEIMQMLEKTNFNILCRGTVYGPYEYDISSETKLINNSEKKIQSILQCLQDNKSIKTFKNLLEYRKTNNYKLIEEIFEVGHQQYFPIGEIIKPTDEEVFIDAGGYNGDTSVQFSKWVDGKYNKIYILEPDKLMGNVAKEYVRLNNLYNVQVIEKGAYSNNGIAKFTSLVESGSSNISEAGNFSVETLTIDSMLEGEKATYIKMDVEGSEMAALLGAEKTIEKYRPNLAICIYHKDCDLWEIPYYIHEKYPDYKLYIRHYSFTTNETVLYAVK